jgi:DNA-binding NarL/FixJ family response regulator
LLITCINDKYPDLPFIVCSSSFDKRHVVFCLQNGAKGILSYNATSFEIINAIYVVSSGGSFFSKPASKLLDDIFNKIQTTKRYSGADKISKRELEIIGLFAEGLTYKEIANKLNISPRTVETHKNIFSPN